MFTSSERKRNFALEFYTYASYQQRIFKIPKKKIKNHSLEIIAILFFPEGEKEIKIIFSKSKTF